MIDAFCVSKSRGGFVDVGNSCAIYVAKNGL
jgi:hypothetical protein